jgi:ceramide glucosyltransferase
MLFRRETLEKIGGFWAFRDILAEDYLMGMAIKDLGLEVRNCQDPINNINEKWKVKDFYNRHLRWAKLRKNTSEFYYLVESLSNPISIALIYTLIRFDLIGIIIFLSTIVTKISIDILISKILKSDLKWIHYSLIPLKDLIIGIIWYIPHFSRTVVWRGNAFKITKNTRLIPIPKG